jgi:hypothetical protein
MTLIEMTASTYARMILVCLAIAGCSSASDGTGPPQDVEVQLTVDQTQITNPGHLTFEAKITGAGVKRVDLYQRRLGPDGPFEMLASDSTEPFTFLRPITSPDSNGTFEYTARAFNADAQVAVSNVLKVIINISDPRPLEALFTVSHQRITTPGSIKFGVQANKSVSRLEVYSGDIKVASLDVPTLPYVISVPVTATDNGTKAFVVKAYDDYGNVAASSPMSVLVDIRWDIVHVADFHSALGSYIATDGVNAVYIAGTTTTRNASGGLDSQDGFIEKFDASGTPVWSRAYGGPDWESIESVAVDASGNVFVAGSVYYPGSTFKPSDCFLVVYSSGGAFIRSQGITGTNVEHSSGCQATSDAVGNYYVFGFAGGDTTGGTFFVTKYAPDGTQLWLQKLRSAAFPSSQYPDDQPTSIAVDASGVYVGGYTGGSFDGQPNRGPRDVFIVKFDLDGNKLWARQYGTGLDTFSAQLTVDPAGGVYLAGQIDDPVERFAHSDGLVVSYSADGNLRWVHTLDAGGSDDARQVVVTQRGVFLFGSFGHSDNPPAGMEPWQTGRNAFLAQFTAAGELIDIRLLNAGSGTGADGAVAAANGDIYVDAHISYDPANLLITPVLARDHGPTP